MPFERRTVMEQKIEFVKLAATGAISMQGLCQRYNISRPTGYKWLHRYRQSGFSGLEELSKCPKHFPNQTSKEVEKQILAIQRDNPEWGAKKIYHILKRSQQLTIPAKSTIHMILKRNGMIKRDSWKSKKWIRFEYPHPNALWQMDFKGPFNLLNNAVCHPLTVTDDHSRYNLALAACKDQTRITVENCLKNVFRKYGLPEMILSDNGTPWGTTGNQPRYQRKSITLLEKWLIRLNVKSIHGQAYHPQTQGKEERFHRTLKTELLNYAVITNHQQCQFAFDKWRYKYNHQRPHEALDFQVPIDRYQPSSRSYPEELPPVEYNISDQVRKVCDKGLISFKGSPYLVGKALRNEHVAVRQTIQDGVYEVYYCNQPIRKINLNTVNHVPGTM